VKPQFDSTGHPIFRHGALVELARGVWQVKGTLQIPVPRNMTVVQTAERELVLYSVIALSDAGMSALEALGEPRFMVIPHRRHQLDAPFYKARYPALRVVAPVPSRVRRVTVDAGLDVLRAAGIEAFVLPGNDHEDVVMDVPFADGRALVVCESLGNVKLSGALALLLRVLGPPGGGFGVARAVRLREIADRARLRDWLRAQARRSDLRALLFGHGEAMLGDVTAALERAATQV
jgi:hypothetical protein